MNIPTIILFVVGLIGIIVVGFITIKDAYFSKKVGGYNEK